MRLDLRRRVALWCAALVISSGVIVVLLLVVLSGRLLRERNQATQRQAPAGQQGPGGVAPEGNGPGRPGVPGPTPQDLVRKQAADQAFRDVRVIGLGVVAGLTVVSVGVAWLVAGRIVRPVTRMTDTARSIAEDTRLHRRIALDGPQDELHDLADSFDVMLDRLETSFEGQRAFVANTSHELRTPLAVMRTEVDVALDDTDASAADLRDSLRAIRGELDRTTGLVEAMLALARAEVVLHRASVDLADEVRAALGALPADRLVTTDLQPAVVDGDPILVGRLVANLVQNAARYNRPAGTIHVATASVHGQARLRVENDGPAVPADEVPLLFTRFQRRAVAGEGHGLGLSIVAAIVASHGGTVQAWSRPEGGLRVEVALPAASA